MIKNREICRKIDVKIKNYFIQDLILSNIYHTQYDKRCLILYIISPFLNKSNTHVNQQHSVEIANVFYHKGYNVDIAQYNTRRKIDFGKYDIVFGFGKQFDSLLLDKAGSSNNRKPYTIAFLTGASPYYSNLAELNRMAYFKRRNNVSLLLRRQVHESDGLMNLAALQRLSAAVCTGNMWTVNTWHNMINNIYSITPTGFDSVVLSDINRNIEYAKKNFLWFSGSGMVHKGLDLCIEAFRENPELNLFIAGVGDSDFLDFYKNDLQCKNIHYCGFVDVQSDDYKELCEKCLFCILPSCSEGMASSVLTTMFSGMIPVVTKETGVDIEDWGIEIGKIDIQYLKNLVKNLSEMREEELNIRSEKAYEFAMQNHTVEAFRVKFEKILKSVLDGEL